MSIPDDEQFEKYLKQFRPVTPEPLMAQEKVQVKARRPLIFAAWAAVAAAILIAVMVSLFVHKPAQPVQDTGKKRPGMEQFGNLQPLTIESANALLESAPSFKAAVDDMAFQPESKPIAEGKHSLLALLSKEEVKQ